MSMNILINLGSYLLGFALQELLAREPEGYRTLAAAEINAVEFFDPDFIVTDCHTIRRFLPLQRTKAKIILMDYGLSEEDIATFLLSFKIDGVLATTTDIALIKKALQAISEGQIWIDNSKIKALVHHGESANGAGLDGSLSRKEKEIVLLISQGLTNKEIASISCISEQTVKTHISRIFRKMNVSRRSQLVPLAMKLKMSEMQ